MKQIKVLFVCLGNICRSPTAEGVFRSLVAHEGLADSIIIDSAGTSDWHIGHKPDARTIKAAAFRGYDLSTLRGRQANSSDFEVFDYILAMDKNNLIELELLKPKSFKGHLGLFLSFSDGDELSEVPDPYYGGEGGFDHVLDLVENACNGLLQHITSR